MKALIPIVLFVGSLQYSFAQGQLTGVVKDQATLQPIEFASIAVYSSIDSSLVDGTISDPLGSFLVGNLPQGSFYVVVSFLGYKTQTIKGLQLSRNEKKNLETLFLLSDLQELQGVDIQGQRISNDFQAQKQSYSAKNFESAKGGTGTDVLRNLPGVSINAEGQVAIRGNAGFVLMVNGRPVQGDPLSILSQLPANAIEKVEWISSPSAQYDSEGKAGIINITTAMGATDGIYLQVNSRLGLPSIQNYDNAESQKRYGGDFNLNYVKGKWDVSLGASYQRNDQSGRRDGYVITYDGDTATHFPSNGERSIDELNYSGRFTIGFTPDANNNFNLGFYAGVRDRVRTADIFYYDNHRVIDGQRTPPFQYFNANDQNRRGDFVLGSLDYTHTFGSKAKLTSSFLYEYTMLGGPTINRNLGYPDLSLVYQDEYNTNDNPLNGVRWNLDYTFQPLGIGKLQTGYQFRYLNHVGDFFYERKNNETGEFELVPEFSSEVNLNRLIHTGYLQLDKSIKKWSYGAGVRVELMNRDFRLQDKTNTLDTLYQYDYVRPFFSGNIAYKAKEDLTWKLNFSQRVERETTFKMNPFPEREHSETLEQGDPTVLPEFINQLEGGMIKTWKDNSFFATAYYTRVKNLVNRVNTVYNDTILNRIYSNVGTGKSIGMEVGTELFFSSKWKSYFGGNVYHYSIKGEFDNRPVDQSAWVYSFNLNTTYSITSTLSSQFTFNYLSSRITAQGEDSRFYQPSINVKKTFMDGKLSLNFQWQNIDMGLLKTNEQRITTYRRGEFYTTTNYIYEVDMLILNLSYTINGSKNRSKFVKSEFGEKEF
ncbi:TonB-dependent receptor domain-containing protein [Algoriphagus sp. AK58]|uniref:TonB-dependent receptor domain-containing protein n=1 Tax=Algoriphagus sp. AK58 TaxID=1406877 RepID=UPI00164F530E|nr:TonB-dependent receptor [Algoriphagus sp. AK58]MBC6367995.1 TonB-dependent receptor [Algoriphagus sp. AK58]